MRTTEKTLNRCCVISEFGYICAPMILQQNKNYNPSEMTLIDFFSAGAVSRRVFRCYC